MFKNYFVLNRHVLEVNELLADFTLINAFTQEKNKLVFHLLNNAQEYFIEFNADSSLPYFILKSKFSRAKKNTLDFFASYLPLKLDSIKMAGLDRVIQFNLPSASIYFYIRGKETNIILIDNKMCFESFKKVEDAQKIIDDIHKLSFTNLFQFPEIKLNLNSATFSHISKEYQYLGREIIDELIRRAKINTKDSNEIILHNILKEIETGKPFVFWDNSANKNKLSFFYRDELKSSKLSFFDNVNDALVCFLTQEDKYKREEKVTREIENKFEKRISQLQKKLDHLQTRLNEGCKDQKYQQIANLLFLNIDRIDKNVRTIELENIYDSNKPIFINLIPKLNLRENVNYYFDKAKFERKEFDKLSVLSFKITEEIKKLNTAYEETKNSEPSMNQSTHLKRSFQIKGGKNSPQVVKSKFREFILYDKYLIFVGKNSKNNDELTTGFAKQNDYWFHARSVSGSHVVLRYDKSMGEIPKMVLEKAACLAAFYSKAKTSGLVPVSYSQKKYVIKRKGMEPGKVALLKEKVLIVRPEIPKECKMITGE